MADASSGAGVTDTLNAKQARFVSEYLIDLNATQAAIRAGYSARTAHSQGPRLLDHVGVQAAIKAAQARRERRTEITQDRVLQELGKIGFSDIRQAVRWGSRFVERQVDQAAGEELEDQPHGGALKRKREGDDGSEALFVTSIELIDSAELDEDTVGAIAEVAQTKEGVRIKFHDKQAALVSIGRHLGMFNDKLELGMTGDLAAQLLAARQRVRPGR